MGVLSKEAEEVQWVVDLGKRICYERKFFWSTEAQEAFLEFADVYTQGVLDMTDQLVKTDGHLTGCRFQGCTCGRTEAYKIARADYVRLRRNKLG